DRAADRRRPRRRARARDRPPRSEARQHRHHARWDGQSPGLWTGQGVGCVAWAKWVEWVEWVGWVGGARSEQLTDDDRADDGWGAAGDGTVHVAGAGARQGG